MGDFRRYYTPGEASAEVRAAGLTVIAEHATPYGHVIARRPRRARA
ncbi:MAG TPA: hypothetical protein VGQ83_42505 [Polyangia bacterium]|jgi:hypothetical protein